MMAELRRAWEEFVRMGRTIAYMWAIVGAERKNALGTALPLPCHCLVCVHVFPGVSDS